MKKTRHDLARDFELKHEHEARSRNLELLSHENSTKILKLYKFLSCGHLQLMQPGHIRDNNFSCKECKKLDKINSLLVNKLEIIDEKPDDSRPNNKTFKFLDCGHTKITSLTAAKNNEIFCDDCHLEKLKSLANHNNFEFIKRCTEDARYGFYRLECGHERRIQIGNANRGIGSCHICKTSYTKTKSCVYLLKFKIGNCEILKIGFTKSIKRRIKELVSDTDLVTVESTVDFETGKEAEAFELVLHNTFKDYRLDKTFVKRLLKSGWSECYDMQIYNEAMKIFNKRDTIDL